MPSFRERRFAPLPSGRLWSRSAAGLPTALSRYLRLNRKACHPSALTQASGRVPAFRRAESGGTKLRDSALPGFYHNTIIAPSFVVCCSLFSTMLCTACAYLFHCPQGACVHLSANVNLVVVYLFGQGKICIRLVRGHVTAAARRVLDRRRCACRPRPRPYSCFLQC